MYLSFLVHIVLALVSVYRRDRFCSMRRWEITQLVIGLIVPWVIIQHVIGTRVMFEIFDLNDRYTYTVLLMWKYLPYLTWLQAVTMIMIWIARLHRNACACLRVSRAAPAPKQEKV